MSWGARGCEEGWLTPGKWGSSHRVVVHLQDAVPPVQLKWLNTLPAGGNLVGGSSGEDRFSPSTVITKAALRTCQPSSSEHYWNESDIFYLYFLCRLLIWLLVALGSSPYYGT